MRSPLDVVAQVLLDHQVHCGTEADQGDEWYHEDIAAEAMRAALEPEPGCTTGCIQYGDTFSHDLDMTWPFVCIHHQAARRRALERDEP